MPSEDPQAASGLGDQLFGSNSDEDLFQTSSANNPLSADENPSDTESDEETEITGDGVGGITSGLESTTISPGEWSSAPRYTPIYLDTTSEYIPAPPAGQKTKGTVGDNQDGQWGFEGYEKPEGVDDVFQAFLRRNDIEPHQCVRYG